jgi:hypothetical protein
MTTALLAPSMRLANEAIAERIVTKVRDHSPAPGLLSLDRWELAETEIRLALDGRAFTSRPRCRAFQCRLDGRMMWFSMGRSFFYRGAAASVAPRKAPCGPAHGVDSNRSRAPTAAFPIASRRGQL